MNQLVKITGNGLGGRESASGANNGPIVKRFTGYNLSIGLALMDQTVQPMLQGAVVDSATTKNASDLKLDIDQYLKNFDSYHFFKKEGGLIITGPTQTNVMDLMVVLIQ